MTLPLTRRRGVAGVSLLPALRPRAIAGLLTLSYLENILGRVYLLEACPLKYAKREKRRGVPTFPLNNISHPRYTACLLAAPAPIPRRLLASPRLLRLVVRLPPLSSSPFVPSRDLSHSWHTERLIALPTRRSLSTSRWKLMLSTSILRS